MAPGDVSRFEEEKKKDSDLSTMLLKTPASSTGGWKACSFIVAMELFERFAHHGIASNLVSYLTTELHESTANAATAVNNFAGTNALVPILGGFMADAYWGKYKTSLVGCGFYVLGLLCLTISVSVPSLRPPSCFTRNSTGSDCETATAFQLVFFYTALYMTSIGVGCTSPCFEAFGADQFDDNKYSGRARKSSFFNWWYFAISIGSLIASTALVYIQDDLSWGLGIGIPCAAMAVASVGFVGGTRFYIVKPPGGSPLTRMAQVVVASVRKWKVKAPADPALLFEVPNDEHLQHGRRRLFHTSQFRCLDKAAVCDGSSDSTTTTTTYDMPSSLKSAADLPDARGSITTDEYQLAVRLLIPEGTTTSDSYKKLDMESAVSPWKLCTVTQVEEVKLVLRIVPIILVTLIYGLAHAQVTTLFLKQASTLNRYLTSNFQIASASMQLFSFVTCLVSLPLYDQVFVRIARKFTGNERGITLLQRIGVGMGLTTLCMAIAALVEMKRLQVAKDSDLLDDTSVPLPMSIFWLVPQYMLIGLSNVFTVVGKQEFFYDQVPDTMRSLGLAVYLVTSGAGAYVSSFLISLVDSITSSNGGQSWFVTNLNRCHLDYFYWLVTALSVANMGVYVAIAMNFTYKRVETTTHADHQQSYGRSSRRTR